MSENFSFEVSFYESLDVRNPGDPRVLEILAQIYTKVGRNEDGLSADLRLSKLKPSDPMTHYNLACSLALVGNLEESVSMLKQSIEMGYADFKWMLQDEDLDAVRSLPSYLELLKTIQA